MSLVFMNSISEIEPKYYADGEDAYAMKRDLTGLKLEVGFCFSILFSVPTGSFGLSASEQTVLISRIAICESNSCNRFGS